MTTLRVSILVCQSIFDIIYDDFKIPCKIYRNDPSWDHYNFCSMGIMNDMETVVSCRLFPHDDLALIF